jgi:hypothetical protein
MSMKLLTLRITHRKLSRVVTYPFYPSRQSVAICRRIFRPQSITSTGTGRTFLDKEAYTAAPYIHPFLFPLDSPCCNITSATTTTTITTYHQSCAVSSFYYGYYYHHYQYRYYHWRRKLGSARNRSQSASVTPVRSCL